MPSDPDLSGWSELKRLPGLDTPLDHGEWGGQQRAPEVPQQGHSAPLLARDGAQIDVPRARRPAESAPLPLRPDRVRRRRRRGDRRRSGKRWVLVILLFLGFVLLIPAVSGWWRYRQIDRVDLSEVLATPNSSDRTLLLVGSDSREGIDPNRPDAAALLGTPVFGQRADSLILIHLGETVTMLSLPRDLWVPQASGGEQRINAAFNDGAAELVATVQLAFDLEIHHYAEIDFSGFDDLVDAVGGVTLNVEYPAFDPGSGLVIDAPGEVTLDGQQALAWVRSRRYTEIINGQEHQDPTGDIGRGARQQAFMVSLLSSLGSTRNPFALDGIMAGVTSTVTVDSSLGLLDALRLGRRLTSSPVDQVTLPVVGFTTSGGAAVLRLGEGGDAMFDVFRTE